MPKNLRYRTCKDCGAVFQAKFLINLTMGANWTEAADAQRQCPSCGYQGETYEFPLVVAERVQLARNAGRLYE